MIAQPFDHYEERQSLDRREREYLARLGRGAESYSDRRNATAEQRSLLAKGLIFWSHSLISITTKGEEVLERVA